MLFSSPAVVSKRSHVPLKTAKWVYKLCWRLALISVDSLEIKILCHYLIHIWMYKS